FLREGGALVPLTTLGLAFLGAALAMMYAFVQSSYQARQQFDAYALLEVSGALARLAAVGALAVSGVANVTNMFVAYAGAPVVTAGRDAIPASVWREIWHFTKWVIAACAFTSLAQRLDVFLIAAFDVPKESVGDYCAAVQLTLLGDLVIITLFNVLLPRASR